jgi:hypothetical protein
LKRNFTAAAFINNMKRMVDALVYEVKRNHAPIFRMWEVFKTRS